MDIRVLGVSICHNQPVVAHKVDSMVNYGYGSMASQASSRGGWLASVVCSDVRNRTHILCMYLLSGCRCEANTLLNVPTASFFDYQSVPREGCPGSEAALLPGSPHGCH